jgi:hypothetical protein
MTANRVRVTSLEYQGPTFAYYEFFADETDLALVNVPTTASVQAAAFSNQWIHAGLTPGDTWYYWFRTVRYNGAGLIRSDLATIGPITVLPITTGMLANNAVTYGKMQQVSATSRVLGRVTSGAGIVEEITPAQLTALINQFSSTLPGAVPSSGGGTANFLRADGTWTAPPGNVTSIFGRSGVVVAAANDYSFSQLSGQASLAQLPSIANSTVLGNVSGISAVPAALTATQLTALINAFSSSLPGAVPASGGGTTNFLRADGSWADPGAGGGGAVSSVFGRTGAVVAVTGDYAFSNISGSVAASQLPNPSSTTLGGVRSAARGFASVDQFDIHQRHSRLSQPAATDISGLGALATLGAGAGLASSGGNLVLDLTAANTWTGIQSFTDGDLKLLGLTSGNTILKAPATGGGTITLPAGTGTLMRSADETAFTPIDSSGGSLTFTSVVSTCVNLGPNLSRCTIKLTYPVTADTNNAKVGGLPFTSANSADVGASGTVAATNCALFQQVLLATNGTTFSLLKDNGAACANSDLSGCTIWVEILYKH